MNPSLVPFFVTSRLSPNSILVTVNQMEKSRVITRSMHRLVAGKKASSDCPGAVRGRGSKRKNEWLFNQGRDCLGLNKRRKMTKDGSRYLAVKDLRSRRIFSPTGMKSADGSTHAHLEKGKQRGFVSSVSDASERFPHFEDVRIVVALPVTQCIPVDAVRINADVSRLESRDQDVLGYGVDSESLRPEMENKDEESSPDEEFMVPENEKVRSINSEDDRVPSPFEPFDLVLELDTDSEDLSAGPKGNGNEPSSFGAKGVGSPEGKFAENCIEASSFDGKEESSESALRGAPQVFDKMPRTGNSVDRSERCAYGESSPYERSVEEGSRHSGTETGDICMDWHSNNEFSEKQGEDNTVCKPEQLKDILASGPGSRWLFSGSRFAAFLRSSVGIIEPSGIESASKSHARAPAKEQLEGCCDTGPGKEQLNKLPVKKKVVVSPCSQLKLLQASNISSYRRMLPFCNELAKDLARASKVQTVKNSLPRTDCVAPKGDAGHTAKVLSGDSLSMESVKHEQSGSQAEPSPSHLEPSSASHPCASTLKNPLPRVHCIYPEKPDVHTVEVLSDKSLFTEQVKPEQDRSQSEPSSTFPEARTIQNSLPWADCMAPKEQGMHTVEVLSHESLHLEHVKHEQNGIPLEPSLSCLEPSSTCLLEAQTINDSLQRNHCVASKENDMHTVEVLSSESLPMEHIKSEQNGTWLEPPTRQLEPFSSCHLESQSAENCLSEVHCIAVKEYDVPSVEVSSSALSPMEHVKSEQNESVLEPSPGQLELSPVCHLEVQNNENSFSRAHCIDPKEYDMATVEVLSSESFSKEHVNPNLDGTQMELFCGLLEPFPTQLEPSPSCHPEDSSNALERQALSDAFCTNSIFMPSSNEEYSSPIITQKALASDEDNMSPVDFKSPVMTLLDSVDSTCFSTHSEIPSPLDTPVSVPSKGILKVSPRSCKGVCMCPDCASFRLQAEKASDFSVRQLRDMEVLAMTLTNELTNMRNLIEKSLVAVPQGVGYHSVISHSEVKGASRSALKAEETAKNYLMQMARDCNLHCKIMRMQQRRVKFADRIEVKLFKSE